MANKSDLIAAYEAHRTDIVSRLVAYHNVSMLDAEDGLQDTMLQLLEKWETVYDTLKNWESDRLPFFLFVATLNRCKNIVIRDSRRRRREDLYFGDIS